MGDLKKSDEDLRKELLPTGWKATTYKDGRYIYYWNPTCQNCDGTGQVPGSVCGTSLCEACNGTGSDPAGTGTITRNKPTAEDTQGRRLKSTSPSPWFAFRTVLCGMAIMLAALTMLLAAYVVMTRQRASRPREPSYLANYTQYRHDSLQRHELLL